MRTICKRLRQGNDLLLSIQTLARDNALQAGVVLSAVGCLSRMRVRDASGVTVRELTENVEIVSLMGTVSAFRTHLHLTCSREDLSCVGGHLVEGCVVNTTCELIIGVLDGRRFGVEQDRATGYDEIIF